MIFIPKQRRGEFNDAVGMENRGLNDELQRLRAIIAEQERYIENLQKTAQETVLQLNEEIQRLVEDNKEKEHHINRLKRNTQYFEEEVLEQERNFNQRLKEQRELIVELRRELLEMNKANQRSMEQLRKRDLKIKKLETVVFDFEETKKEMITTVKSLTDDNFSYVKEMVSLKSELNVLRSFNESGVSCSESTCSEAFSDFERGNQNLEETEEQMKKHTFLCEEAIKNKQPQKMVDNTSAIARLANRVLLVAKQESDNSEDPHFIDNVNRASDALQNSVPPMVQDAKAVAVNPLDHNAVSRWRESNKGLLNAVGQVRQAVQINPELPPLPDINSLNLETTPSNYFVEKVGEPLRNTPTPGREHGTLSPVHHQHGRVSPLPKWAREQAPPRPPLPYENAPMRPPPPPETDDEDEVFKTAPLPSQPIMVAAHNLHREVRQWSAKDNDLIAAAQRMAKLMARLSELVHNDDKGSKRELIATAKAIADASADVTRIAKQLARECTDKRIRTNLLQVCERIPTIATQLKILSTVKATMLGSQGSEEDHEATEMLEGNAQNLMQSVKETVRAAESASVKIHAQTHGKLRWVRKQPWYAYA